MAVYTKNKRKLVYEDKTYYWHKEIEYNQIITESGDVLCYDVMKKEH